MNGKSHKNGHMVVFSWMVRHFVFEVYRIRIDGVE